MTCLLFLTRPFEGVSLLLGAASRSGARAHEPSELPHGIVHRVDLKAPSGHAGENSGESHGPEASATPTRLIACNRILVLQTWMM